MSESATLTSCPAVSQGFGAGIKVLLFIVLSIIGFSALPAQTLGLAAMAWLPADSDDVQEKLARDLVAKVENGILDLFFDSGFIGFNMPARLVKGSPEDDRKEAVEFINLGSAMTRGGAQAGILAEVWIGFSRNPDRAYIKNLRLSSLRLSLSDTRLPASGFEPLARSIDLPIALDGNMGDLIADVGKAFPKVLKLN